MKLHKLAVFAVLETRIHITNVYDCLTMTEFTDLYAVEALGYVGGIWLLWNCSMVNVEVSSATD